MNIQIIRITIFMLLLPLGWSVSIPKITDGRIRRLIRQIFYVPPSGESYYNASVHLSTSTSTSTSSVCTQVCVPFHLCVNGSVVTSGANLFAPRMGLDDYSDGPQYCSETEKCCKLSYDDDKSDDFDFEISDNKEITDSTDDKEIYSYVDNNLDYTDTSNKKCGIRNYNLLQPRISGDDKAGATEFPWMIMVLKRLPKSEFYDYQCGGSLIHPAAVLTAAHCVAMTNPSFLHIRAGEWDMGRADEILPHQDREIQSVVLHPKYYRPSLLNDIAILILKTPVELADNVNTICLPPPKYSFNKERCIVSGWGKDNPSRESRFQTVLKKIELPIIPNPMCQMMFRNTYLGKYFRLDNSFICAGGEHGKDACKGDGGSPLVCKIPNTSSSYYQSGIVSWGVGCSEINIPGAYVNVARYRHWIDKAMLKMNLESSSYIHE